MGVNIWENSIDTKSNLVGTTGRNVDSLTYILVYDVWPYAIFIRETLEQGGSHADGLGMHRVAHPLEYTFFYQKQAKRWQISSCKNVPYGVAWVSIYEVCCPDQNVNGVCEVQVQPSRAVMIVILQGRLCVVHLWPYHSYM